MPLCRTIAATTGTPRSPTTISAPRQPIVSMRTATTGGAAEKPRLPANVCSAKDRPIRSGSAEPLMIA